MAKVYVSSTVADLERERRAVMDWLVAARHQPVHRYLASSETVCSWGTGMGSCPKTAMRRACRSLIWSSASTPPRAWYQIVLSLAAGAVGSGAGS